MLFRGPPVARSGKGSANTVVLALRRSLQKKGVVARGSHRTQAGLVWGLFAYWAEGYFRARA